MDLNQEELERLLRWAEEATKGLYSSLDGFSILTDSESLLVEKLKQALEQEKKK